MKKCKDQLEKQFSGSIELPVKLPVTFKVTNSLTAMNIKILSNIYEIDFCFLCSFLCFLGNKSVSFRKCLLPRSFRVLYLTSSFFSSPEIMHEHRYFLQRFASLILILFQWFFVCFELVKSIVRARSGMKKANTQNIVIQNN